MVSDGAGLSPKNQALGHSYPQGTERIPNGGLDTVISTVSYLLGAQVENLELGGRQNLDGAGNALDNQLIGNDYANVLDGGAGADILDGRGGNDTYIVDDLGDLVLESPGSGLDIVNSWISYTLDVGVEDLVLLGTEALAATGNELANRLIGNPGGNSLSGGLGADRLRGEAGADRFLWNHVDECSVSLPTRDIVEDFSASAGDRLDVSAIDADETQAGDQSFSFIATANFSGVAQARTYTSGDHTYLELNTDADNSAEGIIGLVGVLDLVAAAFVL